MIPRSRTVCRWCEQLIPFWTDVWPTDPGVYLFYGYPLNAEIDRYPRMMLLTVESEGPTFGAVYRTARTTIKRGTGAAGFFIPLMVPPDLPSRADLEQAAEVAAKEANKLKRKPIKRSLNRRLK